MVAEERAAEQEERGRAEPGEAEAGRRLPVTGVALLWQPEVVRDYLRLLDQSSNPDTLEGCAGAVQNLAACYWQVGTFYHNVYWLIIHRVSRLTGSVRFDMMNYFHGEPFE